MWTIISVGYLVIGLGAAGFTLAVFPPQAGYRPPARWVILALLSYVFLWPFLALIGLGYLIGQWYRPGIDHGSPMVRPNPRRRQIYRSLYEETPN